MSQPFSMLCVEQYQLLYSDSQILMVNQNRSFMYNIGENITIIIIHI